MFDDRGVRPGLQIAKIITNLVLIAVVIWLIVIVYDLGNKISENQQIPTDSILGNQWSQVFQKMKQFLGHH